MLINDGKTSRIFAITFAIDGLVLVILKKPFLDKNIDIYLDSYRTIYNRIPSGKPR